MSNIVISGYYGFGNAGDEAMLAAILESLLEIMPTADITVITGSPEFTKRVHGVKTVHRLHFGVIMNVIRRCDLLISGGGSLLQDVTSDRSLYYYLSIMKIAHFFNKPVMLYAQGIGPIQRDLAKKAVKSVLNKVDLITVRDEGSKKELLDLGVTKPPIEVTADAVLSMNRVDKGIGYALLQKYNITGINPKIGISVREWKNVGQFKQELALAADRIALEHHADIVFIPMQYPGDVKIAREIGAYMKHAPYILDEEYTTVEVMSIIGCMDLLVGIRLHALIFASLMHVPIVGISYDPKVVRFLHMIGEEPVATLDTIKASDLVGAIEQQLSLEGLKSSVEKNISLLREQSLRNARLALKVIENR